MTDVNGSAISVIIPTLNEAACLPALLDDLARQSLRGEVLVADGGSTDATPAIARAAGLRCLSAPRGRGAQMNAGARFATSDRLLFLHADTRIEDPELLARALAAFTAKARGTASRIAGHFPLRFRSAERGHGRLRRFMEAKTRSARRWTINGDQGLLIERDFFEQLGRYDESLPFFEDQRIAAKIEEAGRWMLLPGEIGTSFRRFETEGHERRYALMGLMMGMHAAGLESFFTRAPEIYAAQERSQELDLLPFIRLAGQILFEQGMQAPAALLRAGRFVRQNAWQLALMAELASDRPVSAFFERNIEPRLRHPICDVVASGLILTTVFGLIPMHLKLARLADLLRSVVADARSHQ